MSESKKRSPAFGASVAKWIAAAALLSVAVLGWQGVTSIPVRSVVVRGAEHATDDAIVALARVPLDSLLFTVSPTLIEDRVRRHPWVEDAVVSRLPTGTVSIHVTERTPVLLALSASGEPSYYVDAEGFRMPYRPGGSWRVPILTGLSERYHPVVPIRNEAVRGLASALPDIEEDVDALLSEFRVDDGGGITLSTTVTPQGRTLQVRLGRAVSAERLVRLRAFWDQVVLARPNARFSWVDLRFDSQIVTNESS